MKSKIFALSLLFVLSACATAGTSQPKLNPQTAAVCDFMTVAEAREILEIPATIAVMVQEIPLPAGSEFSSCGYATSEPTVRALGITFHGKDSPEKALQVYKEAKENSTKRGNLMVVNGVGDEAFWNNTALTVRKGNIVFVAIANKSITEPDLEKAKLVAQKVLARLP